MTSYKFPRSVVVSACVAMISVVAVQPAFAQQSSLRGKVVNEAGEPVANAEVVLKPEGAYEQIFTTKTNDRGEWFKGGLAGVGGVFTVTVTAGELSGIKTKVRAALGQVTAAPDIVVKPGGVEAFKEDPSNMEAAEVERRNKETEALKTLFAEASAAFDAGSFDLAIEKVNGMITSIPNCDVCYALLGDINIKKGDDAAAEAAYLKAIEINPEKPGPFNALAGIYNTQRKFDEAAAMSEKAVALSGGAAGPDGAGGGNAAAAYNQGISLWNAGKAPEAQAAFERAVQMDPKMADAHYWLGMAFVNQGKLKEAKAPFEAYMKLAPDGEFADTVKALLASIGG
jgi:Flp pilus assembly protein TadD